MHFMQSPFLAMESVSLDVLRGDDYINCLKAVYSERPHISLHDLRMKLAKTFAVTASNDIMFAYASLRPRPGLGKRLRTKTSPDAPVVAVAPHIKPYLDKLYEQIAENPSITVQGLSDLFVSKYGKFFDVVQLRAATARLKRRHAIFKAWQSELDVDFGVRREEGLIDPPSNLGSMSEHAFFIFRLW
jgi:hypothetical protein